MKIYLAGKIAKNDWRHEIVKDLRGESADLGSIIMEGKTLQYWPVLLNAIYQEHDYVGPFFLGDDHGCGHGHNSHGNAVSQYETCIGQYEGKPSKKLIVSFCQKAISQADLIYVWLDCLDAYGTLVELGYAVGLGKKVIIAKPEYLHDLWFAHLFAAKTIDAPTPDAGLKLAIQSVSKKSDYEEYLKTTHWQNERLGALSRASNKCQVCNGTVGGLNVHHRTYERLGKELPEDLIVLCRDCHALFHKEGKLAR